MGETSAKPFATPQQILEALPHRYPFLLIDKVLSVDEGGIVAIKNVSFNEPHFQGHFPGQPIMPGVLQVEAMAQAGGLLAAHSGDFDVATQVVLFLGIDGVRFRKAVVPGDQMRIEVEPLRKGRIWKMKGQVFVGDDLATQGELMATMAPREGLSG